MKANRSHFALASLIGTLVLVAGAGWFALTSRAVPYNVRELSEGRPPLLTAMLLAVLLLVTLGAPAWAATVPLRRRGATFGTVLLFLLLQALLAWLLVRVTVPEEAIHDIVGSPVLGGSREAETAGRFLALFLGAATVMLAAAAAWVAWEDSDAGPLARCGLAAIVTLPLSYLIVVPLAATDNLTELLRRGGVLPAAAIGGALAVLAIAGSGLSRLFAGRSRRPIVAIGICLVAVPLGYALLFLGLEPAVSKYGRTFSALQFLLSEDREHLATGTALWLRYVLAFTACAGAIVLMQHAAWTASGTSRREPPLARRP
jgi:hypothetical protein